jgi:periplasmic protein TonB
MRLWRIAPGIAAAGVVLITCVACGARAGVSGGTGALTPFEELDSRPELVNSNEVTREVARLYPRRLRDRGLGGRVVLDLTVDSGGDVINASVAQTSGHRELDRAALRVARMMRFTPPTAGSQPVSTRMNIPLSFATRASRR